MAERHRTQRKAAERPGLSLRPVERQVAYRIERWVDGVPVLPPTIQEVVQLHEDGPPMGGSHEGRST